jgi:hypothetical protein
MAEIAESPKKAAGPKRAGEAAALPQTERSKTVGLNHCGGYTLAEIHTIDQKEARSPMTDSAEEAGEAKRAGEAAALPQKAESDTAGQKLGRFPSRPSEDDLANLGYGDSAMTRYYCHHDHDCRGAESRPSCVT